MIPWVGTKPLNLSMINKYIEMCQNDRVFTNGGQFVRRLERMLSEKLDIASEKRVVCVNNGTSALHAIVGAYCLRDNRLLRFATQAFTFPSSAQGILKDAQIVDVDKDGGIDLNECERHLSNIDGIIVTNAFGNLVDISKYVSWCTQHSKILVFDNAGTAASYYNQKSAHNFGDAAIISMHHTKPIGFGEGGAIVCSPSLENFVRRVTNFGIDNCALQKAENWSVYGNNFKMSEISAIYQLQFLKTSFESVLETHTRVYKRFAKDCKERNITLYPNFGTNSCAMCLAFFHTKAPEIVSSMIQQSIFSRQYYNPLASLPMSLKFRREIVCIPCNGITETNYDSIWCVIDSCLNM